MPALRPRLLASQDVCRPRRCAPAVLRRALAAVNALAALGFAPLGVVAQPPLSLHEAIQLALSSPEARVYQEQVSSTRGQLRQAALGPNPRLYLQSEDLRPWADHFSFANDTEDYGYLGQTIELDGKRTRRVVLARSNLRRAEAEYQAQTLGIAGRVAAAYWTASVDQRVAHLLEDDLQAVDRMVVYHRERVDAGAMRGVDLLRVEIERDRVALALAAARRDAELARIDLYRQIGRPAPPTLDLADAITSLDPPAPVSADVALAQRADLAAAREAADAARADLRLQHANAVPDPDLLIGYKRNSGFDTLYAAVQLPLPVRNRNQGAIETAQANVRQAEATLEQLEIAARAEIAAAQENLLREQQVVQQILPGMQRRARENLTILDDAYRTGGIDLLRYIDAERTEIDVEVSALRTLAEYHQSILRLELATGVQP